MYTSIDVPKRPLLPHIIRWFVLVATLKFCCYSLFSKKSRVMNVVRWILFGFSKFAPLLPLLFTQKHDRKRSCCVNPISGPRRESVEAWLKNIRTKSRAQAFGEDKSVLSLALRRLFIRLLYMPVCLYRKIDLNLTYTNKLAHNSLLEAG